MSTPACLNHWPIYDALIDDVPVLERRAAADAARQLCGACPIRATCHAANEGEPWLTAMRRKPPATTNLRRWRPPGTERVCCDACGCLRWETEACPGCAIQRLTIGAA